MGGEVPDQGDGRIGVPARPIRSHWVPRTATGRIVLAIFLALFALAQPPVVHGFADRVEPWILGMPFLYAWLLGCYLLLIAVMIAGCRKGL